MRRKARLGFIVGLAALMLVTLIHREKSQTVWEKAGITREMAESAECCGLWAEEMSEEEKTENPAAQGSTGSFREDVLEESYQRDNEWGGISVETGNFSSYRLSRQLLSDGSPEIRVLIKTSDYRSLLHEKVLVTSDGPFIMENPDGSSAELLKAGSEVEVTEEFLRERNGSVTFYGEEGILFPNVDRACGHPDYPGKVTAALYEDGIALVNSLSLETYLERVVAGEMPESYGEEALKAQAVCARSYCCSGQSSEKYTKYGADVDDSTSCQVYNNQEYGEKASLAVRETKGQVLVWEGQIAEAFYYSTSYGYGADFSIWGGAADSCGWIAAHSQDADRQVIDLSEELDFRRFLEGKPSSWDQDALYFRWNTMRSAESLGELTKEWLGSEKADQIGTIQSLSVTKRAASGCAEELEVVGDTGSFSVTGQDKIRRFLGSTSCPLVRNDGSESKGMSILPSAYFYLEKVTEGWKICGGGFGHGVGMSQDGAKGMDQAGYTYLDILSFFYNHVNICQIY
ncbi:MAG: SpoIID/LytB domain-containing protein [Clostridiales bacterium]|nr:SpoIID/LytB domain-containing protein [Clostridiales bacterium]